ncbi:hypothetical protein K440DRAFT_644021 [Wilcoxina mikolae CBS 423.85]|nr:hypothetical protein K440DRAFT_644021 [Wilcoxina mikolae CBS 423.85]
MRLNLTFFFFFFFFVQPNRSQVWDELLKYQTRSPPPSAIVQSQSTMSNVFRRLLELDSMAPELFEICETHSRLTMRNMRPLTKVFVREKLDSWMRIWKCQQGGGGRRNRQRWMHQKEKEYVESARRKKGSRRPFIEED